MADDRERMLWWDIRDARDLDAEDKAILWAVGARGVSFASVETMAADAGVSRATFHRRRDRLLNRGLLIRSRPPGARAYRYRVDGARVVEMIPSKVSP